MASSVILEYYLAYYVSLNPNHPNLSPIPYSATIALATLYAFCKSSDAPVEILLKNIS